MFGLLKDKILLVCWSQGSRYSLRVSIGSLYGVRPNQIPPMGRVPKNTENYPHFVDKEGGRGLPYNPKLSIKLLPPIFVLVCHADSETVFLLDF